MAYLEASVLRKNYTVDKILNILSQKFLFLVKISKNAAKYKVNISVCSSLTSPGRKSLIKLQSLVFYNFLPFLEGEISRYNS